MLKVANECEEIGRWLADRQNDELTLKPIAVTRIVNALMSSANTFKQTLKDKAKG